MANANKKPVDNSQEAQDQRDKQKFSKTYYIIIGIVLIFYAFQSTPANELFIYSGIAMFVFAFLGDLRKLGFFKPRRGSMLEKVSKQIFPEDAADKNNSANTKKKN